MTKNSNSLLLKSPGAGAGLAGLIGSTALFALGTVFYITENYFVSLLLVSFALLVYAAGTDTVRIALSSFTIFFSSRHLIDKANYINETLNSLRDQLQLNGSSEQVLKTQLVVLPNNPLALDLQRLINQGKGFDSVEYTAHTYFIECHELYDNSSANLDFIAVSMPVFGLIGTVLGLVAMFDNLAGEITVDTLSPHLAMALKTTLYGAFFSAVYKILCSRFERRIRTLDYNYETLCRGLQVLIENKIKIEIAS